MNRQGLDHEPLFVALAWFNGMTATLMVGRLSRRFIAQSETPPREVVEVDRGEVIVRSLRLHGDTRPHQVSFRSIMPPRGRGPGLDLGAWISPPTPRNAVAVRDACRLRHSNLRPGRSSCNQGPSPGAPLSGARGVCRDDRPPHATPLAMPPGGPRYGPARGGRIYRLTRRGPRPDRPAFWTA